MNLQDDDIQLFLLDPEALWQEKRFEIEQAMESDPSFACRVADCVDGLQQLGHAAVQARFQNEVAPVSSAQSSNAWRLPLALSLSIAGFVALGWVATQWDAPESEQVAELSQPQIEQLVATSWSSVLEESADDEIEVVGLVAPESTDVESDDWMLDALLLAYEEEGA